MFGTVLFSFPLLEMDILSRLRTDKFSLPLLLTDKFPPPRLLLTDKFPPPLLETDKFSPSSRRAFIRAEQATSSLRFEELKDSENFKKHYYESEKKVARILFDYHFVKIKVIVFIKDLLNSNLLF